MTTIAVAQRATVTGGRPLGGAAGGAREEDHPGGLARDVLERVDHLGLAPPGRRGHGDRGPHALVELAAELLDEPALVLADVEVALGDQLLAVTRPHAEELHGRDYVTRTGPGPPVRCANCAPSVSRRTTFSASTGPAPRPRPRSPCATASAAISRAARAASSGEWPSARWAASAELCVQPDPCAAPSGWRTPGSSSTCTPSKNTSVASSRCPPVTTTFSGPSAYSARASSSASSPSPTSTRASGRFGVI